MQDQRISRVLWRGKWIILVAVIVGAVLAVAITHRTARVYQATGMIQVNSGTATGTNQSPSDVQIANQILASTYATELGDSSFLDSVRGRVLGGKLTTGELLSRISVVAVPGTAVLKVTADGPSPASAQRLAGDVSVAFVNSVHRHAVDSSQEQQRGLTAKIAAVTAQIGRTSSPSELDSLRGARSSLQQQLANVIASGIQQGQSVSIPSPPTAGATPISPRPTLNLIAGILLGLIVGIALSWARVRLDRGLHSSGEAETLLDVPVLAAIPVRKRFSVDDPVLGEAYDVLRANLRFLSLDDALQVFTLSSYNPREGKSSTVEGLAFAAGRGGISVAIVDGDVRTRNLSSRLGYDGAPGLTNIVVGAATLDEALVELAPGISLLPTGPTPPNPPSLLGSAQMRDVIEELRGRVSLVLIDSPPVAHLADASILASVSDGVIVVARVGTTARSDLVNAAANLRHSPTPIVGSVILEQRTIDETYYPAMAKGGATGVIEPLEMV